MFTLFIGAVSAEEISSDDSLLTDSVNSDLSQINIIRIKYIILVI